MGNSQPWEPSPKSSVAATVFILVAMAVLAGISASSGWMLPLAASVGAIGGLAHEIAQSRGKLLFFKRYDDGLYLGSITGMILGAVAGILIVRGHIFGQGQVVPITSSQLAYEAFFAGLGLKGVAEAANSKPVESKPGG